MKHAYVVMDNDYPLFVAESEREAEDTVDRELNRIETTVRIANGNDEELIQQKLTEHHLHWVMVPFVSPHQRRS